MPKQISTKNKKRVESIFYLFGSLVFGYHSYIGIYEEWFSMTTRRVYLEDQPLQYTFSLIFYTLMTITLFASSIAKIIDSKNIDYVEFDDPLHIDKSSENHIEFYVKGTIDESMIYAKDGTVPKGKIIFGDRGKIYFKGKRGGVYEVKKSRTKR